MRAKLDLSTYSALTSISVSLFVSKLCIDHVAMLLFCLIRALQSICRKLYLAIIIGWNVPYSLQYLAKF